MACVNRLYCMRLKRRWRWWRYVWSENGCEEGKKDVVVVYFKVPGGCRYTRFRRPRFLEYTRFYFSVVPLWRTGRELPRGLPAQFQRLAPSFWFHGPQFMACHGVSLRKSTDMAHVYSVRYTRPFTGTRCARVTRVASTVLAFAVREPVKSKVSRTERSVWTNARQEMLSCTSPCWVFRCSRRVKLLFSSAVAVVPPLHLPPSASCCQIFLHMPYKFIGTLWIKDAEFGVYNRKWRKL